jgi:hypothetical protein
MRTKNFLVIISTFLFITGCISVGDIPLRYDTTLTQKNFQVVKKSVRGEDSGFSLFCILPFAPPSYADAMQDLHNQVSMIRKSIALVNVTRDESRNCFILFGIPKTTISATVIKFTE